MGQFDGKVAFITGAGRGQGREHSLRLAAEGATVALVDIGNAGTIINPSYRTATSADLNETKRLIELQGGEALLLEVDVRDFDALSEATEVTAREFGGIDFVVANAAILDRFGPVWEVPPENWRTVLDVNLNGAFYTCRATVPHVRQRGPGGAVVLVSSSVAIKPRGHIASYYVSKVGIRALALSLAKELGPDRIRCNSLHPGAIRTDMAEEAARLNDRDVESHFARFTDDQLLPEVLTERDITAALIWLLSDEARHVTGLAMVVDAGESRI